jgi:hypothetical protein
VTGRRRTRADSESAIYDGNLAIGSILVRNGKVTATNAAGKKLGTFKSDKLAMAAIHSARRAA